MTTFLLIPGAGGAAWFWHLVAAELTRRGHDPVPVELPAADETAGLAEYTDVAVAALDGRPDPVVVAQSMGAFTGPLVCARIPTRQLILVNPMVPAPGESGAEWWGATDLQQARKDAGFGELDMVEDFFHDVPADVTAEAMAGGEQPQSDYSFSQPWPLAAWPDVRTAVVQGVDDRLFPLEFQRRVTRERLGLPVHESPGGHLSALSRPVELTDVLLDLVTRG
ncbi:MAG: alpha/beta hydrolase [Pseudonocardia sp.]|nr:alpha/beta hydrolase [Pseudonocardia sp.]